MSYKKVPRVLIVGDEAVVVAVVVLWHNSRMMNGFDR